MAVAAGGSQGLVTAWNAADDNAADRLLALEAQEGRSGTWVPDTGTVLRRSRAWERAEVDVGVNVYSDGVTTGANTLSSVSSPFAVAMTGLPIVIFGHGRRVIEAVTGASQIQFSGPVIAAATGLRFTVPLGISAFLDGVTDGSNDLTSASAPFTADMVGRRTSIDGIGTRVITVFTAGNQVTVDGAAMPAATGRRFTVPVFEPAADRTLLSAASKVLDSHRSPATNSPTVIRWHVGRGR